MARTPKPSPPPLAPDSRGKEAAFKWEYFADAKSFNAVPADADRPREFSIALRFDSPVSVSAELDGSVIIPKVEDNWAFIKCNPGNLVVSADSNLEAVSRWEP